MRLIAALLFAACVKPLPLPPSPDIDYCGQKLILPIEEWRALCGKQLLGPPITCEDGGIVYENTIEPCL